MSNRGTVENRPPFLLNDEWNAIEELSEDRLQTIVQQTVVHLREATKRVLQSRGPIDFDALKARYRRMLPREQYEDWLQNVLPDLQQIQREALTGR